MATSLQYRQTSQRAWIPSTCAREHHNYRPKPDYALTFIMDHRMGAFQRALPRVADEDKQAEFIAFYQDLMTKLPADEAVYFADAVHPEHQTKPAFGWVVRAQTRRSKPLQGAAGSTSMAAYIWKNSMRRLLSLSMLAATMQYSFWQRSRRITQANHLST